VVILPFVGASALPVLFLLWRYVFSGVGKFGKLVGSVVSFLWFAHCFLTFIYGNVNNDAYSDSWIVDVSAPTSYWNEFRNIEQDFKLSHNSTGWSNSIAGPHLPPLTCDGHTFVRFMCHRILTESRVSVLLTNDVMFCGAWAMVERKDGQGVPKVFTDFAFGNDIVFNGIVVPYLIVDTRNLYDLFDNTLNDAANVWDISSKQIASLYEGPFKQHATFTGNVYPPGGRNHIQDQYSCMNEALWMRKITGKGWCFNKMMKAGTDLELQGTLIHPLLKEELTFPQGDMSDCSKPVVRGVFTKHLHWVRDNYLC